MNILLELLVTDELEEVGSESRLLVQIINLVSNHLTILIIEFHLNSKTFVNIRIELDQLGHVVCMEVLNMFVKFILVFRGALCLLLD